MFASISNSLIESAPRSTGGPVTIEIYSLNEWSRIAPLWAVMAQNSPYSSFYLSENWTSVWLEIFGQAVQPQILLFKSESTPVGVCMLVQDTERRGPFRVSRVYLNTGAGNCGARPFMEFNSVLCLGGWEQEIASALGSYLATIPWDEFAIEGICLGPMLSWLHVNAAPEMSASVRVRSSCYVDLDLLRLQKRTYQSSLSSNTREQIRRSARQYAKWGPLEVTIAADIGTAQRLFEEMRNMHQDRWARRGQRGAFAPGNRLEFHHRLIRRAFPKGAIQMLRVAAGNQTIGILYNFVQHGKVYFFQSGLNYALSVESKPGLTTHALAIQYCLDAGFSDYDFLAGDAQYKRSMAKDSRQLQWVVFSRPGVRLAVIELLRVVRRRIHTRTEPLPN